MIYLLSSLPSLSFDQHPPITMEEFLSDAKAQLGSGRFQKLESLDFKEVDTFNKDLKGFDKIMLQYRDDLKEIRKAKAENRTPGLMILSNDLVSKNPLECEKSIMKWQWDELSSLEAGENFTFTEILIYKLKLQILSRLESFQVEKGRQVLESVVNPKMKEDNS
ncbi:hypothetical protein [Marinifilum breve]|nr:hypothetical protein [Marinifilum breve]